MVVKDVCFYEEIHRNPAHWIFFFLILSRLKTYNIKSAILTVLCVLLLLSCSVVSSSVVLSTFILLSYHHQHSSPELFLSCKTEILQLLDSNSSFPSSLIPVKLPFYSIILITLRSSYKWDHIVLVFSGTDLRNFLYFPLNFAVNLKTL